MTRRSVLAVVLGVLWITVLGFLDALEPQLTFFGSLTIASVGVSLFAPARVAFGVWLYGFAWALAVGVDGVYWSRFHFLRLVISAFVGGSAVAIAILRERRDLRLEHVTQVAIAAQRALLRVVPSRIDDLRIATRYVSAAEEAQVGGDFLDAAPTPFGVRVIVGDVVGRGLDAVGLAGLVLGGFREAALSAPDLPELARRLDAVVRAYTSNDEFVTALLVESRGREISLVSCGHPFPILLDAAAPPAELRMPTSVPLGFGADPEEVLRTLRQGERLFLHTDGLTEARDAEGRFFDLGPTMLEPLARTDDLDAGLEALLAAVDRHAAGELRDDIAVVLLEPVEPEHAR